MFFSSCSNTDTQVKEEATNQNIFTPTLLGWEELQLETVELWSEEFEAIYEHPIFSDFQKGLHEDTVALLGKLTCIHNIYIFSNPEANTNSCVAGFQHFYFPLEHGQIIEIKDSSGYEVHKYCDEQFTIIGVLHLQDTSILELEYSLDIIEIVE